MGPTSITSATAKTNRYGVNIGTTTIVVSLNNDVDLSGVAEALQRQTGVDHAYAVHGEVVFGGDLPVDRLNDYYQVVVNVLKDRGVIAHDSVVLPLEDISYNDDATGEFLAVRA